MKLFLSVCCALLVVLSWTAARSEECPECDLVRAIFHGDAAEVSRLIKAGAGVSEQVVVFIPPGVEWTDAAVRAFDRNLLGSDAAMPMTPFHAALVVDRLDLAGLLIDAGVDVKKEAEPAHLLRDALHEETTDELEFLLKAGLSRKTLDGGLRELCKRSKSKDMTPHLELFLKYGLDVKKPNDLGRTALDEAMLFKAAPEILSMLKEAGAVQSPVAELLGAWLAPGFDNQPGAVGKMIFDAGWSGTTYDRSIDTQPMATFSYEAPWMSRDRSAFHLIQRYGPGDVWYSYVNLQDVSGMTVMTWVSLGHNVEQFPESMNVATPFVWQGYLKKE